MAGIPSSAGYLRTIDFIVTLLEGLEVCGARTNSGKEGSAIR